MKILLVSSDEFIPQVAKAAKELVGGLSGKKVAIVPNGGVGKERMEMVYEKLKEFSRYEMLSTEIDRS
jgi:hypothetical protein